MQDATERVIPEAKKTANRVVAGIFALVALAIALSLGALIAMLLVRPGLSRDPKLGGVLSLIASFVVFFGVTGVHAATFALRPRAELMRVEGWRILTVTLAACGLASALAYHWAISLSWLAMALFCLLKEPRVRSWLHALGLDPSPAANELGRLTAGGPGYFKIGTLRATEVFAHWTIPLGGIAISAFVGFDFREAVYYTIGYLCVIALHELGHVLAARVFGLRVFSVQISGVGGFCRLDIPRKTGHAFVLYSAGLLAQAVLLVAALLYHSFVGVPTDALGRSLLQSFTVVNLVVLILNIIPSRAGGLATDGRVLWQLLRHVIWKHPNPFPLIDFLPSDKAPVFPPETSLLSIPELVPDGFDQGVEILNDRTTPMLFVVATIKRHLERTQEDAILLMGTIHNKGGALIRLPTRERAEEVAKAITAESAAAGHRLVCRAVDATSFRR